MLCNTCTGDAIEREAVILQKMRLSLYEVGGIKRDFCYVPVCEEHKSKSDDNDDMFISLDNCDKRITELELRLEIEQLRNRKCNCPICSAIRNGLGPPNDDECIRVGRIQHLQAQLEDIDSIELECQCPECIDMRANHGQTRLQLREEVALVNKRLSESRESLEASETIRKELSIEIAHVRAEYISLGNKVEELKGEIATYKHMLKTANELRDKVNNKVIQLTKEVTDLNTKNSRQIGLVLKFIRTYFTTYRFPGLEAHHSVCVDGLSDKQLIELIKLGNVAYHSKMAIQEFVDTLE